VDVACFALRLALWNLSQPKLRNTIILDEPFRYLSSNLQDRAASMLKEISSQLGIQIIMISHIEDIIGSADKIFKVEQRNGVSRVTEK
jgi:DNA repair exonuclease SbcCD ATPase subunit